MVGDQGLKYPFPQKLTVATQRNPVPPVSRNRCLRDFKEIAVGSADTKPVPPVSQNRFHRVCLCQTRVMCTCGFYVSHQLSWDTWALRHNQDSLWYIPLDSTTFLNSRSNIKAISCTWASSTRTMPYYVHLESCIHLCLFWNEHFNLELVTWTFVFQWNPLLVQLTM